MLTNQLHFAPERDAEIFAAAAPAPAVFLLRGREPGEPYVSKTANLRRRLIRLLAAPEDRSRKLSLRDRVSSVEYALTGSDFESGLLLYHVLRREFPKTYAKRLRLRPAPLVRLILENQYPRATVTTRIATLRGRSLYYGPFPSRAAAEKFASDSLDFFKMRRCVDDLHPDPQFPGCIYSEMKMCLAPCFKGCTDAEYQAEVARVQAFFDSGGRSLVRDMAAQRDAASQNLEFEAAAAIHMRIEKLTPVLGQLPEIVRRIDHLAGVVVQPSAEPDCVNLFRIEKGRLSAPIIFPLQHGAPAAPEFGAVGRKPLSMEARVTEALAAAPPFPAASAQETMEQLAYLKRWYYRTNKVGEIFFANSAGASGTPDFGVRGWHGDLPLRRIVRGISRVFRGERPAGELSETARDYWINRGKAAGLNPEDYNV
ncbi:MAG: hypothetical protein ACE14M_13670 [Terriglobales bacterium]